MKKIFISIIAFGLLLIPSTIYACSCMASTPETAFNRAKAVFIGRMLGGTEKFSVSDEKGNSYELEAGQVRFTVDDLFKGGLSKEVTVNIGSMRGTSCGDYGLRRDTVYVVYAYGDEKNENVLYSGVCTRTSPVDNPYAKEDLKFLRNLPPAGSGGNLEGRVWLDTRKTTGGAAESMPNVKVKITGADGKTTVVTTGKDGKFALRKIKAGKYRVAPQVPANYYVETEFQEVEVADRGTADIGFEAYFSGKVTGGIADKNGVGFNNAFLRLVSVATDENARNVYGHSRGGDGEFEVEGVPPGEYLLYLELENEDYSKNKKYYYPGTFKREEAKVIKVGLGEKISGLVFPLPGDFDITTVEGQVFRQDGKPASDAEVLLLCPQSNRADGFRIEFTPTRAQTDRDGKFKIQGFLGGTYWLQARSLAEGDYFSSRSQKIDLTGDLKDVKLTLSEDGISGSCEN